MSAKPAVSAPGRGAGAIGPVTCPSLAGGRLPLRRILIIQTQRLGDVVCATPLFAALRRQFPAARLTVLVHSPFDTLLSGSPDLDEVMAYDRRRTHRSILSRLRLIGELRRQRFDWALCIHAASSVAFAVVQARIPWRTCVWRYGDRKPPHWARWFHQHVRQDRLAGAKHEIDHNLDVLRQLGMEPGEERSRLYLRADEREWAREWLRARGSDHRRPLAILHPGHGGGRQIWPAERFAAVGDGLSERGFQVAVTGSGAERELVTRVTGAMTRPALPLAGGTSLRQLCAVIAETSLFVSVPTGPMHLASALQVPVVALYGPADLRIDLTRFCPYHTPYRVVPSHVPCTCASSHTCSNPVCMTGIAPADVLAAAEELAPST